MKKLPSAPSARFGATQPKPKTVGGIYRARLVFGGGFTPLEERELQIATFEAAQRIHRTLYILEHDELWEELRAQGTKGYLLPNETGQPLAEPRLLKTAEVIEILNKDRKYWIARLREVYNGLTSPYSTVRFFKSNAKPTQRGTAMRTYFTGVPDTRYGFNSNYMYVMSDYWWSKNKPTDAEQRIYVVYHELARYFAYIPGEAPDAPIYIWDAIIGYINDNGAYRYRKVIDAVKKARRPG